MFKWKVSTLGGGGKKSKSPSGKLNNEFAEEERKHYAGEEGDFATPEADGYHDLMAHHQPNHHLVSTGYYPTTSSDNAALLSPQLPQRAFFNLEHGTNGYNSLRQNGLYHATSMRQLNHQRRQPVPEYMQENFYSDAPRVVPQFQQFSMQTPSSGDFISNQSSVHVVKAEVEREDSPSDNGQAQAYLAWVNWQLRKKPGINPINDICELKDDRLLAALVQIVSAKSLIGLDNRPPTQAVCLINMERILAHLAKQRVKVTTITPHDLAGGNVKAIMKLIQSLAAFYKPHSVGSGRAPGGNTQATPDLNVPSNRKLADLPSQALCNGQPSMGLTVRAVATLRRPPKSQQNEQRPPDVSAGDPNQQKKLNLSAESLDRNKVNAQIQATLMRKSENSSQTALSGGQKLYPSSGSGNGFVPATPQVTRSARIDRKPSSVDKTRSGSMPPLKNLQANNMSTQLNPVKRSESKVSSSLTVKRSESKATESSKKTLQLNRSGSSAAQKSEMLNEKNSEDKRDTPFKFWGSLGRRKLPESPKCEKQGDEKPLDLSADDSAVESSKAPSKSDSRGDLSRSPLDVRGEVEGSSNNTSPVNSDHEGVALLRSISAGNLSRNKELSVPKVDVYDRMEKKLHEVQRWLFHTVAMDPSVTLDQERTLGNGEDPANVPYDVVLRDLHTARKQLVELQSLLLSASSDVVQQQNTIVTDSRGTTTYQDDMDFYGSLKPLSIENLKLSDVIPEDANPEKLRQALIKSALRQHRLNAEKTDLQKKLEEKEKQVVELRKQASCPDRLGDVRSPEQPGGGPYSSLTPQANRRSRGREELQIARDALTSLRSNFRNEDPNQHTIDTLEQCVSMLLERLSTSDQPTPNPVAYRHAENMGTFRRPPSGLQGPIETTKAVYFTERSLTPFLVVLQGRLGDVTLRDFRMALDRSTRYRFMFKTPDPEYGFVKQEICDDDAVLPGFDGKVVAWLEEDCL